MGVYEPFSVTLSAMAFTNCSSWDVCMVPFVYVVRDNDEPGRIKAEELVRAIGKGRIIKPLDGHKDTGEVMQANLLDKWMFGGYGLEPVYR
jgi:hypothetical protein